MSRSDPVAELEPQFSSDDAKATEWADARDELEKAEIYWISTVRSDGRPHVTPMIAVWLDEALYFCTGERERKAKNLAGNPHCVVSTGCNSMKEGLDIVIEGDAVNVRDEARLQSLAEAYISKYGYGWRFEVRDSAFYSDEGGRVPVFEVAPIKAFGFGKGDSSSQTRWRFGPR
jgi:nitroimidazol reductase NimA-like FMN-containing flavoprotein (pyridoxamine 5'-phosphate oxidase superfamily)